MKALFSLLLLGTTVLLWGCGKGVCVGPFGTCDKSAVQNTGTGTGTGTGSAALTFTSTFKDSGLTAHPLNDVRAGDQVRLTVSGGTSPYQFSQVDPYNTATLGTQDGNTMPITLPQQSAITIIRVIDSAGLQKDFAYTVIASGVTATVPTGDIVRGSSVPLTFKSCTSNACTAAATGVGQGTVSSQTLDTGLQYYFNAPTAIGCTVLSIADGTASTNLIAINVAK